MTKGSYGDCFELARRRKPMSIAAELAWQLLPPLTFATDRLVITGAVAPAYGLGGDSFDYSVDAHTARIAVFDAMGHGLEAGLLASVAMAASRNCRRQHLELAESVATLDETIALQFGPERFVTGVLADLDLASGRLRWSNAGHPPPLLLRAGKVVKTLSGTVGCPFGLGLPGELAEECLEPADQIVFFTDGVVEARSADGEFFGIERLADLLGRASASQDLPPETMRRLLHAILDHQAGTLHDDVTIVLLEWRGAGGKRLRSQTG